MSRSKNKAKRNLIIWIVLSVALVLIRAFGIIQWPWGLVTAPFWGTYALFCLVMVGYAIDDTPYDNDREMRNNKQ